MVDVLYVDACVRRETSRTERLAQELLSRLGGDVESLVLETAGITGLNSELLALRDEAISTGDFSNSLFDYAKRFLKADVVVFAAPFWEFSFPYTLKAYLELISVPRLTYRYTENGMPEGYGHCQVFYVTTRGGMIPDEADLGFAIINTVCRAYGSKDVRILSASGLDIIGNDVDEIMADAIKKIPKVLAEPSRLSCSYQG